MHTIKVVGSGSYTLGYIINSTFYPERLIAESVSSDLEINETKRGVRLGNTIIVDGCRYSANKNPLRLLGSIEGFLLKDIIFIKQEPSSDDLKRLSSYWRVQHSKSYIYLILDSKLNKLGYIVLDNDYTISVKCYICMIEIFNKNQGTGKRVIKALSKRTSLTGYSYMVAHNFWKSLGANFTDDFHFELPRYAK